MFAAGKTKGASAAVAANYIEDVFSTWLYTGNSSTQTITNGIDLAGKGGLVWAKQRNAANNHALFDTSRGTNKLLYSNSTSAQVDSVASYSDYTLTSFNSNGFTLGNDPSLQVVNTSPNTYTSWTFRKQPKFFDVVTYTGNGTTNRQIPHSLGSTPGCVIVKRTDASGSWVTYHRGLSSADYAVFLNYTNAQTLDTTYWNSTAPTSTNFTVGSSGSTNQSGGQFVAYLFAHNAGGFGLTGTDNVISCGSFTADGSGNATINLGYEPQWVMVKRTDSTSNWFMVDSMRGNPTLITSVSNEQILRANTSDAETSSWGFANPTATGFQAASIGASSTWIYIAIRRGPMKTPTTGTSVFGPTYTSSASNPLTVTTGFPVDLSLSRDASGSAFQNVIDRLRGGTTSSYNYLTTQTTNAEATGTGFGIGLQSNTGIVDNSFNAGGTNPKIYWNFRRAPGFFDEVCWNGTNSDQTLNHNLGVVPELLIFKPRTQAGYNWEVSTKYTGSDYLRLVLQLTNAGSTLAYSGGGPIPAAPTATQFSVGQFYNPTGGNVAYLFASCPGVSKVGSYTGNGTTQTINCGFTGGARFVLIKRTDSTGDWYVYDTARGMTTLTDPYLLLNSTAAESATLGSVTTVSTGFAVNASILAAINTNAASYIFLAIA